MYKVLCFDIGMYYHVAGRFWKIHFWPILKWFFLYQVWYNFFEKCLHLNKSAAVAPRMSKRALQTRFSLFPQSIFCRSAFLCVWRCSSEVVWPNKISQKVDFSKSSRNTIIHLYIEKQHSTDIETSFYACFKRFKSFSMSFHVIFSKSWTSPTSHEFLVRDLTEHIWWYIIDFITAGKVLALKWKWCSCTRNAL